MSECDSEEFASCDWLWGLPFVGPRPEIPWSCTETKTHHWASQDKSSSKLTSPDQHKPQPSTPNVPLLGRGQLSPRSFPTQSQLSPRSSLQPRSLPAHPNTSPQPSWVPAHPYRHHSALSSWGKWLIGLVGFGWGMMSPPQARIRNSPESPRYISTSTDEHKVSVTWSLYTCARYISKQDVFTQ